MIRARQRHTSVDITTSHIHSCGDIINNRIHSSVDLFVRRHYQQSHRRGRETEGKQVVHLYEDVEEPRAPIHVVVQPTWVRVRDYPLHCCSDVAGRTPGFDISQHETSFGNVVVVSQHWGLDVAHVNVHDTDPGRF